MRFNHLSLISSRVQILYCSVLFIYYFYLGKYFVIHFAPAFTNLQHSPYIFNSPVTVFRFRFGISVSFR